MGDPVKNNAPVECKNMGGTAKAVQAKFDAAVKSGESSYLGSIGGDTASSTDTNRVVGQVKLFWRKDNSFHAVGKNGYDVVVNASGAQDAIIKTRQLLKTDKVLSDQATGVGKDCVKFAPISKAGRYIKTDGKKPEFLKIYGENKKNYYIALYKTSDKWAVGMENGAAVTIASKLSGTASNRDKMILTLINEDKNRFQRPFSTFLRSDVKKYTEEDIAKATGQQQKPNKPISSPPLSSAEASQITDKDIGGTAILDSSGAQKIGVRVYVKNDKLYVQSIDGKFIPLKSSKTASGDEITAEIRSIKGVASGIVN